MAALRTAIALSLAVATSAAANGVPRVTFEPPSVLTYGGGMYVDNVFQLQGSEFIAFASPRTAGGPLAWVSSDGSAQQWSPLNSSSCAAGVAPVNGPPLLLAPGMLRNSGNVTATRNATAPHWAFSADEASTYSASGCGRAAVNVSYTGLPQPVSCAAGGKAFGGCPFRLQGGDAVWLNSSWAVQSVIVYWGGNGPFATSIVAFGSADGSAWRYLSVVANASAYPSSQEGPNENALSLLSDGTTLACVMRFDAGDGPETHPYVNYRVAYSSDGGASWSAAVELPNAGCARPRLLHLGNPRPFLSSPPAGAGAPSVTPAPLLLSGGRMETANITDILLWLSADGFAPLALGAPISVSYWHNALVANASLRFTAALNDTAAPRQTSSYTSILPLDGGPPPAGANFTSRRLAVTYNRRLAGQPDVWFAIPFTVDWA